MKKPYRKLLNKNTDDSHQTSPAYMLTVVRYENRDTFNYEGEAKQTRKPLVIINDAINVTVSNSKKGITSSLSAILLAGDLNYSTAIAPGDYVFANIVNWDWKIAEIDGDGNDRSDDTLRSRAAAGQPINNYNDGFKGAFKVQKVSRVLKTDPNTGIKAYYFEMQAFGFTEFNTSIYYDPQIYAELSGNFKLFMQQFESWWGDTVSKKESGKSELFKVQNIIPTVINATLGIGRKKGDFKGQNPSLVHFQLPENVSPLLGLKNARIAADFYHYYIGIWKPSTDSESADPKNGFNPKIKKSENLSAGFFNTGIDLQGNKVAEPEYWNNVKIWSIIQKYTAPLINEMYTTYRVNTNGRVMPSLVIRQKPFTSEHFQKERDNKTKFEPPNETQNVTRFLDLPRWVLSPDLVYSMNLGRDEASRVNFVQIYTRTVAANDARNRAAQSGTGNYQFDVEDIARNGLKPFLATADYDYPEDAKKSTKGKDWANLIADMVIGGHLRESGTIECVGIEEPISVGDNLEFNGIVYHIEAISHNISISASGKKSFKTNLTVSFGIDPRSDEKRPVYPEMDHQDTLKNREEDYELEQRKILPGFSDTQSIGGRRDGEEIVETKGETFTKGPRLPKNKNEASGGLTSSGDDVIDQVVRTKLDT